MPTKWINYRELKERINFEDVLRLYGVALSIRPGGKQHMGYCPLPQHQGQKKSPSFSASLEAKIFQCFGCGAKGNMIEFAALMEGLDPHNQEDFRKAAVKLSATLVCGPEPHHQAPHTKPENEETDDSADPASALINPALDFELKQLDAAHPYLKSRGFSDRTIKHFGLGFCAKGMMTGRIAIPLHDPGGNLIGYAGRIVDESALSERNPKYRFPGKREKNGSLIVFRKGRFLYNGWGIAPPAEDLLLVEGFTSVWWLWQQGFQSVVAVMGASCSKEQAGLIGEITSENGRVWILSDGDAGGERCAEDALRKIAPTRFCRWLQLSGGQQPTDLEAETITAMSGGLLKPCIE